MAGKKKRKVQPPSLDESNIQHPPRSFVIRSGSIGKSLSILVKDFRWVMQPNTAGKLKEKNSNKLKDYIALAGPFHISHFMIFSCSNQYINFRICKVPHGPTFSFHIQQYTLMSDVAHSLAHPKSFTGALYTSAPLLVLNNMPTEKKEYHLLTVALQNMFPTINVSDVRISQIRRIVLFHYQEETDTIIFRHYAIDVQTTGVTKAVKKILTSKVLPNLHDFNDISDYVQRNEAAADSEVEDKDQIVTLPEVQTGKNAGNTEKRAVKLTELGPRMELSLFKIQDALCTGEILYHRYVQKTEEEKERLKKKMLEKQLKSQAKSGSIQKSDEEENESDLDMYGDEDHSSMNDSEEEEDDEEDEDEDEDEDEGYDDDDDDDEDFSDDDDEDSDEDE